MTYVSFKCLLHMHVLLRNCFAQVSDLGMIPLKASKFTLHNTPANQTRLSVHQQDQYSYHQALITCHVWTQFQHRVPSPANVSCRVLSFTYIQIEWPLLYSSTSQQHQTELLISQCPSTHLSMTAVIRLCAIAILKGHVQAQITQLQLRGHGRGSIHGAMHGFSASCHSHWQQVLVPSTVSAGMNVNMYHLL